MALSYMQEGQINAGIIKKEVEMKQEEKPSLSPPLTNTSVSLFPRIGAAAAAAGLSMLTPQQFLAASRTAALMAAGLPLHASLAATRPLYTHNQPLSLFGGWAPPAASSPPLHQAQGPVSPALISKSTSKRTLNNNNSNVSNNNNIVSSSVDRITKKTPGKKRGPKSKSSQDSVASIRQSDKSNPPSPPISISPEGSRDTSRDKNFVCGVCSRSFGYKHVLQNHERTHTGEKPFECPECHKRFTRDHHLKTHMRLHTGEKPYHCKHCDRQFVQVANLRRHLRVHTGERPYVCEVCSAKFSDSNQLKAHLLIHKGEKPFECEHCQMRFRRRHHLIHHKCGTRQQMVSPVISEEDNESDTMDYKYHPLQTPPIASTTTSLIPSAPRTSITRSVPLSLPLNLSNVPDLPEQTEPEDLSMHRSHHSHSSIGDSPLSHSHSPSSDNHDDEDHDNKFDHEEEDDEEMDKLVAEASPSSFFINRHHQIYQSHSNNSSS